MEDAPAVVVLVAEQGLVAVVSAGQCSYGGKDYLVPDADRPLHARFGDVVEQNAVVRQPHMLLLECGGAVVVVQLGVLLAADTEQAEVDQPDSAGGDTVAMQAAALQVVYGGRPQRGQRAGEPQHVSELLGVALLSPQPVVQVLGPAPAIHAGRLDVAERVRRDPDVLPGGRDPQRADAVQGQALPDLRA